MIEYVIGDITKQHVDVIVNAANVDLAGGGGVDGAIHRAGGPTLMEELARFPAGCSTGGAVLTTGGDLPARYVVHAVGPVWTGGEDGERELLASAYQQAFQRALEVRARTIALPAISCGIYGFPAGLAAPIAARIAVMREDDFELIRFVFLEERFHRLFEAAHRVTRTLAERA